VRVTLTDECNFQHFIFNRQDTKKSFIRKNDALHTAHSH
jgi:hypothetical protein